MEWFNDDPRERINKRSDILILRPTMGRYGNPETGQVETKEGWSIRTNYEDHPTIEEWDPLWIWTFLPKMPT